MKELRRTGRTTRMLEHAISMAKEGRYVLIYCSRQGEAGDYAEWILKGIDSAELSGNPELGAKIRIGSGSISFERISPDTFDWRTLRGRGIHPDVITLVDHYTIEQAFPALTEMLHRFI